MTRHHWLGEVESTSSKINNNSFKNTTKINKDLQIQRNQHCDHKVDLKQDLSTKTCSRQLCF